MIRANEVVFILTMEDVIACAEEMDIPKEKIDDAIFHDVKKAVAFGLECCSDVMKTAIRESLDSPYSQ